MKITFRSPVLAVLLAFVTSACGGGSSAKLPRIELTPAVTDAEIESTYPITITNTGDVPLSLLAAATLTATPCADDPVGTNPFTLVLPDGVTYPVKIAPQADLAAYEGMLSEVLLTVNYNAIPTTCDRIAVVTIPSDDPDRPSLQVRLKVVKGEPKIGTDPAGIMDLGFVAEGENSPPASFTINNTGTGDLHVKSITFIGADGFYLQWPCVRTATSTLTADEWLQVGSQAVTIGEADCEEIVISKNSVFGPVPVQYRASSPDKAVATVIIVSDDPGYNAASGEGIQLELRANYGGPCVRVVPAPLEFGTVLLNDVKAISAQLESCGDKDVDISDLAFSAETSLIFQLDTVPLGAFNAANPITLAPGAKSQPFFVKCLPEHITTDAQGALVADTGTLLVKNSSPGQVLKVPMKCLPAKAECAVCEFTIRAGKNGKEVKDGDSILPLYHADVLYFTDDSFDKMTGPGSGIKSRVWDVAPKNGSASFVPNNVFTPVTYQPNVIDTYTFTLTVVNQVGCSDTCSKVVKVAPPPGCHVELTWNTPSDPDQTDTCGQTGVKKDCGSDMDLHVVHPLATSSELDMNGSPYGYFDDTYDCYWMNANPKTWDTKHLGDVLYQPHLDRDDTDGAGPENWTYAIPPDGLCYRVGVNYFDDHGFGKSYPTIRVFINNVVPVYERTLSKAMIDADMWDVGKVCCTDMVTPFVEFKKPGSGDPVIVQNYPRPL